MYNTQEGINNSSNCNGSTIEVVCDNRTYESLEVSPIGMIRDINIQQIDYGYIVQVGCQRIAIENIDKLIELLVRYIKEPNKVTEEYYSKKLLV
jgi:hypothetical protein